MKLKRDLDQEFALCISLLEKEIGQMLSFSGNTYHFETEMKGERRVILKLYRNEELIYSFGSFGRRFLTRRLKRILSTLNSDMYKENFSQ